MDKGVDGRIVVVVSSDDVTLIDDDSHYIIGITQHVHNYHYKSIHPLQWLKDNIALTNSSSNGGHRYAGLTFLGPYLLEDGERLDLPQRGYSARTGSGHLLRRASERIPPNNFCHCLNTCF